jgi:hypothetical protein
MDASLIGSWETVRSTIPGYIPGREWLRFAADGSHLIEQLHPGQDVKSVKIAFTLLEDHPEFVLRPVKVRSDGSAQDGWRLSIVKLGADEIAVTPRLPNHGFTTIYRRMPDPQNA